MTARSRARTKTQTPSRKKAPAKKKAAKSAAKRRPGAKSAARKVAGREPIGHPVIVRKIGGSHGVILPKEILASLRVTEGSKLFIVRTGEGFELTPYDPDFAKVIEDARDFMNRHRDAFRELARG